MDVMDEFNKDVETIKKFMKLFTINWILACWILAPVFVTFSVWGLWTPLCIFLLLSLSFTYSLLASLDMINPTYKAPGKTDDTIIELIAIIVIVLIAWIFPIICYYWAPLVSWIMNDMINFIETGIKYLFLFLLFGYIPICVIGEYIFKLFDIDNPFI